MALPTEYCRSRYKLHHLNVIEFDFSFYDKFNGDELEEILDASPPEFQQYYQIYLQDRTAKWIELPLDKSRCHFLNDSQVPMFVSAIIDIAEFVEHKDVDLAKTKSGLYKLLVQKAPLTSEGELIFELDELKDMNQNIKKLLSSEYVDAITSPCDITGIDLFSDKGSTNKNPLTDSKESMFISMGVSQSLFNATGTIGLDKNIQSITNMLVPLLKQFEIWYNYKLKPYNFGISFPPLTHFNRKEMFEIYHKAVSLGFPTKLLTIASLGIDANNTDNLLNFENEFLNLPEIMTPPQSAHTGGKGEEGGSQDKEDDDLTDEGIKTREGEKNKK